MSEKHYYGDVGEVEYVRFKQPNMSSETYYTKEYVEKLHQQITKLKKQLKNAIVPKFKYGQDVWCVYPTNDHRQGFVFELDFVGYTKDKIICRITKNEEFEYDEVFSTEEEAQAKLRELQGEKK